MQFSVVWSQLAEVSLDQIYAYHHDLAGERIARKLIRSLIKHPEYLIKQP